MQRKEDDVNEKVPVEDRNEMEERRISMLDEAGINEEEVLSRAKTNLNVWTSYFNENITRGKDDINFTLRDQWTAVERSEFTRLFKPALTVNKLYDPVKKNIGEQRKNKPDLIVRSLNGKADQEELNLRADLIRAISYHSQNDLIYQTAFKSALLMGFGAFQVSLDYESPRSFNRIIKYDLITDPTLCAWDPVALMPHKGDGNYASRRYFLTRDQFFATYPYIENPVSFIDPYMLLDLQWTIKDTICLCDEFVKEWYPLIIYKLSDGTTVTEEEWKEREKHFEDLKEFVKDSVSGEIITKEIPKIVGKRQTQDYKIMQYRMIRDKIVDFSEWPSKQLPIIYVDGDSYYIEGRQYTKSFVHDARDSQKLLNYARSETAAELKNRRREQWIGTPDNIIGYEQQWRNPETQNGILMARPDPKTGAMPMKMPAWDVSQGLFMTSQSATQDMREVIGFSENEQPQADISGRARRERKLEGSMASYVFFDNLNQAMAQGGRIVNDVLPYIVGDDERHMSVSRKNGKNESILLNERKDNKILNRIQKGDFDVEIDTGASFAVQKEIALEFLQQTLQAFPQAFPLIADLWAKNLDVQFMEQITERFKTLVPPEVLAKEEGREPPPKQPSPQDQMMAMQQQMAQQKMQLDAQQLAERAENLKLSKKRHELEEAELMMRAHEMKEKMNIERDKMSAEGEKSNMDFVTEIAKIVADAHK